MVTHGHYGDRPVHVGFADTSFLLWMAKQDWEEQAELR
jgi:hypothetical protein